MGEPSTVRKRVLRAAQFFAEQDAVVLTTFNLSGAFLEDNALPAVLGVDEPTAKAALAQTHERLATTACTVFYDPHVNPKISGRLRYVARPVPRPGFFFHPKLVIMAGRAADDRPWVYLAVSSANLSLSGWGRNVESFGETWIYAKKQQTWEALDALLAWLEESAPLGEGHSTTDAVTKVREVLASMRTNRRGSDEDDDDAPWSGTLDARLYTSVVHTRGLASFLQGDRKKGPESLWVYSPYWADVAAQVARFDAKETVLFPALSIDGKKRGIAAPQVSALGRSEDKEVTLRKNPSDGEHRFCHVKAYYVAFGETEYTAVGSCNFTRAGLVGGEGNVEAMLVFEGDPDWFEDGEPLAREELSDEPTAEEETPNPTPVCIIVAFDWRAMAWRWYLGSSAVHTDFVLSVPHHEPMPISAGTDSCDAAKPPPRGASFEVMYQGVRGPQRWRGQVVELNLDHSTRVYGKPLTAMEILESWSGHMSSKGTSAPRTPGEEDDDSEDAQTQQVAAAFDAVNLYALYRATRALRERLDELDEESSEARAMLVGRPTSAVTLAHRANEEAEAPVVRYLVLYEINEIVRANASRLDAPLVRQVAKMKKRARAKTLARLVTEVGEEAKAKAMLRWFEKRLGAAGKGAS